MSLWVVMADQVRHLLQGLLCFELLGLGNQIFYYQAHGLGLVATLWHHHCWWESLLVAMHQHFHAAQHWGKNHWQTSRGHHHLHDKVQPLAEFH